ncbi:MAG: fibronectin type III domain-containing protein [Candidatus Paceibacterota bacterium]|jgi:hypothetical protein
MKKYSVLTLLVGILTLAPLVYAVPVPFSASATGENSIDLSWTTDVDITSHEVFYSTNSLNDSNLSSAQSYGSMPPSTSNASQVVTISGLTEGTTYYFAYQFVDTIGNSFVSYASAKTKSISSGGGVPSPLPVTNFAVIQSGTNAILSWDTPNSAVLSQFTVAYSTNKITNANFNSATRYVELPLPVLNTRQSVTISDILPKTSYYFAIRTVNIVGETSPIVFSDINASNDVLPISNLIGTSGNAFLDLSWDTPVSSNTSLFDVRCSSAELTVSNFTGSSFINNAPLPISGTKQGVRISGLSNGIKYWCGVRIQNTVGEYSPIVFVSAMPSSSGNREIIGGNSSLGGGTPPATIGASSIIINNGAIKTNRTLVVLTISAVNANEMMLSNSADFRDAKWEPYAPQTQWVLILGDGEKIVYAKFRNASFFTAGPIFDSIILETEKIPPASPSQQNIPIIIVVPKRQVILDSDRPYSTIISISPNKIYVPSEEKVVVVLTAHPGESTKYGAHLELDYSTDMFAVDTIDYGDGWVPEYESAYNYDNTVAGRLIKTAKHDPFNESIHFATVTFAIKKSGAGMFDTNSFSALRELPEYKTRSYVTQADTSVIDPNIGKTRLMFANLISLATQDNTIAVISSFIFLFLCYVAYVISMHRMGKRKLVLPLPLKRQD